MQSEHTELIEELQALHDKAYSLWARIINESGGMNPASFEMTKTVNALRNTKDMLETGLSIIECQSAESDGLWHGVDWVTQETICGTQIPLLDRITSSKRIPNCSQCREILKARK